MLIIASFLLSLSACGYKANPYYQKKAPVADDNVEFVLEKKPIIKEENNESCE